jgi:hypothetical protein
LIEGKDMKKIKIYITILLLLFLCTACDECGKTTYRPELGIGYVFMYDTNNDISFPVAGATVIVENMYWTQGLFGKTRSVAEESYITDVEGRYQVRFVEKGCYTYPDGKKEMIHCNTYVFHYEKKQITGIIGLNVDSIKNYAINNIFLLDTIKIK